MSWRLASRLSVITLALLVVITVALWELRGSNNGIAATNQNPSALQGTDLGGISAPDFSLKDQFGKTIKLSQFQGQPVVITFLYTHCPDVCPLTAEKLHAVQLQLGKDISKVTMLAVSIDPKGDTRASALKFSQAHKLNSNWHYLIGGKEDLSPVWDAYSIYAQPTSANTSIHTQAIYIIDKQGRERLFLNEDFTPAQMTSNLRVLLGE
ncbi:MAG TPA: SCO family protein [Ktedonobacteraceae bacterium]|nr:SCO family protein [Ktedonobacteraceae bacterium]